MDIVLQRIISLIPQKPDGNFVHGAKKDFANTLGLPSNIVAEWISGRNKSYTRHVHAISNLYNVSVEWLEGRSDIKQKTAADTSDGLSNEEIEFIQELRQMSEDERKFLIAQMRGVNLSKG